MSSPLDTIVRNWSLIPSNLEKEYQYRGDIKYDGYTMAGFLFYDGGNKVISSTKDRNRSEIIVRGVETVLRQSEKKQFSWGHETVETYS